MSFFKKNPVKEIHDAAWGHLVTVHKVDVDTLTKEMRCVERDGQVGGRRVTLTRVFRLGQAQQKGVVVSGWETLDQHPDLIVFEGHVTQSNEAHLERKQQ